MDDIGKKFKDLLAGKKDPVDSAMARLAMIEVILRSRSIAVVGPATALANIEPADLDRLLYGTRRLLADLERAKAENFEKPTG